jgi:hypothetical protein
MQSNNIFLRLTEESYYALITLRAKGRKGRCGVTGEAMLTGLGLESRPQNVTLKGFMLRI